MPSKQVSPPYQNFTSASMTGTATLTSSVTNILYRDNISIELDWTGTPTGTFFIEGSNSYNPGIPQAGGGPDGPASTGTWTALTLSPNPVAGGSASNLLINLDDLAFAWIRVRYTNSAGSGTLNGWIAAKSKGA